MTNNKVGVVIKKKYTSKEKATNHIDSPDNNTTTDENEIYLADPTAHKEFVNNMFSVFEDKTL